MGVVGAVEMSGEIEYSMLDLLDGEEIILLDGEPMRSGHPNWYSRHFFDAQRFQDLDEQVLEDISEYFKTMKEFFTASNVRTTPLVYEEMQRFESIVHGKLEKLTKHEQNAIRYHEKQDESTQYKRQLLETITFQQRLMCKKARKKVFNPDVALRFEDLENKISIVSAMSKAKKDFSWRYNCIPAKHNGQHADEQLVAAGLYLSIVDGKQVAVVSPDSDMGRILDEGADYLRRCGNLMGLPVKERLCDYPVRVYFALTDRSFRDDEQYIFERDSKPPTAPTRQVKLIKECIGALCCR